MGYLCKVDHSNLQVKGDRYLPISLLTIEWLATNGFLDDNHEITESGELYLQQLKTQILAQIPIAKKRLRDLHQYPNIYLSKYKANKA